MIYFTGLCVLIPARMTVASLKVTELQEIWYLCDHCVIKWHENGLNICSGWLRMGDDCKEILQDWWMWIIWAFAVVKVKIKALHSDAYGLVSWKTQYDVASVMFSISGRSCLKLILFKVTVSLSLSLRMAATRVSPPYVSTPAGGTPCQHTYFCGLFLILFYSHC